MPSPGDLRGDMRRRSLECHAALVASGALVPLSTDAAETRAWLDCQVASLVENRFHTTLDPRALDEAARADWTARAVLPDAPLPDPHRDPWYAVPYWIVEDGVRVGTIGLSVEGLRPDMIGISSLYVMPDRRRRGIAARALGRVHKEARRCELAGLRVPTWWSWQPTVRFYLALGMWVGNWKHDLVFTWLSCLPPYRLDIDEDEARFTVDGDAGPLLVARRRDRWLELEETRLVERTRDERWEISARAPGTLALALAVRGWPLVRSEEHWTHRWGWSDGGMPEGLAVKIEVFEALDRRSGFCVRTPRIPGLGYRDLDAID